MTEECKKPPLGIRPKKILTEIRIQEICDGIKRYSSEGKQCPVEWIRELSQLNNSLREQKKDFIRVQWIKLDTATKIDNLYNNLKWGKDIDWGVHDEMLDVVLAELEYQLTKVKRCKLLLDGSLNNK